MAVRALDRNKEQQQQQQRNATHTIDHKSSTQPDRNRTMTRLRTCRGIAVIASIAVMGGPRMAVCSQEGQQQQLRATADVDDNKLSSRFLTSLEQADAAHAAPSSNAPLAAMDSESIGDGGSSISQRRELSWWNIALQLGKFLRSPSFWCACPRIDATHASLSAFLTLVCSPPTLSAPRPPPAS